MNKQPRVRIVILNYNESAYTIDLCKQLEKQDYKNFEIIVVDNASNKDQVIILQEQLNHDITLILSTINLGYAAGNNLGLHYQSNVPVDYHLVLNNDIIINDNSFITKMLRGFSDCADPNVVASSPLIESPDFKLPAKETIQVRRIMDAKSIFLIHIPLLKPFTKKLHRKFVYAEETPYKDFLFCESINGAAFMVTNDFIVKNNFLDNGTFLFFEEIILGRQIKDAGKKCLLNSTTSIVHLQGVSTKSNRQNINPKMERYKTESTLYYLKKYEKLNSFFSFIFVFLNEISLLLKRMK